MGPRVITPEAVVLELPTAGVGTRAFARLVDLMVQLAVMSALAPVLLLSGTGLSPTLAVALIVFVGLLVVPIVTELIWRGRSLGKATFGLRVVGMDGSPEGPRQVVIRALVALIDTYLSVGLLAVAGAMFSEAAQRPGDMAAGTVVIRARASAVVSTPIAFHPPSGYENYVSTLDVGALDDEDFTLVRELLLRVNELSPPSRAAVTLECAEAMRAKIRHVVPGPIDPELWLVCVASAYQLREGGLLSDAALGLAPLARR